MEEEVRAFASLAMSRRYECAIRMLQRMLCEAADGVQRVLRRRHVSEMIRHASAHCLRSDLGTVHEKLEMIDFFLACFAEAYDTEGQFVMQYESLMLRETYTVTYPELRVTADEWMQFARECVRSCFYSNAVKAYDMALQHITRERDRHQAITEREFALEFIRGKTESEAAQVVKRREEEREELVVNERRKYARSSGAEKYVSAVKRLNMHKLKTYAQTQ